MKLPAFSLSIKLFLVVFLTSLLAIVVMSTAMRLGFQRGFLDFLTQMDLRRLTPFERVLERTYAVEGGWGFLRADPRNWQILLTRYVRAEELHGRLNPPAIPPPSPALLARLGLLDEQRNYIAGTRPQPNAALRPLRAGDRVVGFLAVSPVESVSEAAEVSFLDHQLRILVISAAVTAALAALAAALLTRLFVRPIRTATRSIRQLAGGRYDLSLRETSRDDVGRLYADINHLAATLANNERLRREYASDIAHELRTPLAILRGELEAIEDGVRPMNEHTLASLRAELGQLSKLVDDLHQLQLADKGALTYRKQPVDLAERIADERARFAERYAAAGIDVQVSGGDRPVMIHGDADQLGRLFSNLFENTLRYTDAGGALRITLDIVDDRVDVDFMDSAPGVNDAELALVFERMYRTEESRNRASGGHGLGLAICQKIVAAHRGRIEARHSPLGGVWMHLEFPRDLATKSETETA